MCLLSKFVGWNSVIAKIIVNQGRLAEREGFEPTVRLPYNGFRVLRFLMLAGAIP